MNVSFITTSASLLDTIPVVDGQIIAISDSTGYYYDMAGERRKVSNVTHIDDEHSSSSSVYSSAKIDALIEAVNQFEVQIVATLPVVGDSHVMYFLHKTDKSGDDYYDEYMYISGRWEKVGQTKVSYELVTHSKNGLMSFEDKIKLDGIAEGADVGTITGIQLNGSVVGTSGIVNLGNLQVASSAVTHPEGQSVGTAQKGIYASATGALAEMTYSVAKSVPADAKFTDTTYNNATQSVAGLMSAADKTKLDSALTYSGAQVGSATQGVYITADGTPAAMTYSVNKTVPADAKFTDTTYSNATQSAAGLMSALDKQQLDSLNSKYGGYDLKIVTALPASPAANTFYVILES